jgi:hypothetical protein
MSSLEGCVAVGRRVGTAVRTRVAVVRGVIVAVGVGGIGGETAQEATRRRISGENLALTTAWPPERSFHNPVPERYASL